MKKYKILCTIIICINLILALSIDVLAFNPAEIKGNTTGPAANTIKIVGSRLYSVVSIVGTAASVIMIIILGVKYMLGSIEEKAEYKKTLLPYLIGAIFVLCAMSVARWIYSAITGFFN